MNSKITAKYQITIPSAIRKKLKLSVADALEWKVEEDRIYIERAGEPFLAFRGAISVGSGEIVDDIEAARKKRAKKYR